MSDNILEQRAVTGATVTVGGLPATVDGPTYSVTGVPVGSQLIVVDATHHMTFRRTYEVLAGDNTFDLALPLTVRETSLRYRAAWNNDRTKNVYSMFHEDMAADYTFEQFTRYHTWIQAHHRFISGRYLRIRTLDKWRPARKYGPYRHVRQIIGVAKFSTPDCPNPVTKERTSSYWVRDHGMWMRLFNPECCIIR